MAASPLSPKNRKVGHIHFNFGFQPAHVLVDRMKKRDQGESPELGWTNFNKHFCNNLNYTIKYVVSTDKIQLPTITYKYSYFQST